MGFGSGYLLLSQIRISALLYALSDSLRSTRLANAVEGNIFVLLAGRLATGCTSEHGLDREADLTIKSADHCAALGAILIFSAVTIFLATFSIGFSSSLFVTDYVSWTSIVVDALGLFGFFGVLAGGTLAHLVVDESVAGGELFGLLQEAAFRCFLIVLWFAVVVATQTTD